MEHRLTAEGLKPDPNKVKAFLSMQKPANPQQLRSLLGCVTYLSKFLPNLAKVGELLRKLTRQGA